MIFGHCDIQTKWAVMVLIALLLKAQVNQDLQCFLRQLVPTFRASSIYGAQFVFKSSIRRPPDLETHF